MNVVTRVINVISNEGVSGLTRKVLRKSKETLTGKYELNNAYDEGFFAYNLADSRPQAEWLAPRLAQALNIKSCVDIGCATGHWVSAFLKAGVDAIGVEGSVSAKSQLLCPADRVTFADLREPLTLPAKKVDLVMSIEVAEHIEPKFVDQYLANITRFNPGLIFITAATPGQGGHYHVNEQPFSYWIDQFRKLGYAPDATTRQIVSDLVDEGRSQKNVPAIMKNPEEDHEGVWIPHWMPKNLLVFRKL